MYAEYLKNGYSSGDNLLGFVIDVESYLENTGKFFQIKVQSTEDKESLILASCKYRDALTEDDVVKELENIWEYDLRYREFEKHSSVISEGEVIFNFCSVSGGLGVTGKIKATRA